MASGDSPSVPPSRPRPAPTIDLKATEITSEPADPAQASESKADIPEEQPPAAASGPTDSPPKAAPSAASGPRAAEPPPAAGLSRLTWGLGGAGVSIAAMLVLLAALWGLGAFGARDNGSSVMAARLTALEAQMRELANRPLPAGLDQRVFAELAARLGAAEQNVARLAAIEAGLAKLEAAVAKPPAIDSALVARVAALEQASRELADMRTRLDALDATQKNAKPFDPAELAALVKRMAALEQAEKAMEQRVAQPTPGGADKAGRVAFVAIALRAAVERGDPFAREFAAARALASDAAVLAPLEPYATSGVPRAAALARELAQLAGPMLTAAGGGGREGGIFDRLQQNAERLVRVRPVNETQGDDPAAIISRAEAKAAQGDIAGALAELARLPEAARAPAQDWIARAGKQVAALTAARQFAEGAVDALAKATP